MARYIPPRRPIPRAVTRPVAKGVQQNRVVTILGNEPSASLSTLVASPWGFTDSDTDVTVTTVDANADPMAGVVWTASAEDTAVSASLSTVEVSPSSIENDDTETATITATVKNANGVALPDIPAAQIAVSSTGSGNTIAALSGVTDAQGRITTTIKSTTAETKTLSATVCGLAVTDTASLSVQAVGGTVATFTDISRDASNTDGGDLVTLTVSTIVGTPEVRFDGILADDITVASATTITCRVPANPSVGVCDVVCGGVGLTNPRAAKIGGEFEYLPVASTVVVDTDFETGSIPAALTASGTTPAGISVQTTEKYAGTYAVQAQLLGADTGGDGTYIRNTTNLDVSSYANGFYIRYYQKYGADTLANLGDQIKSFLFRTASGTGQPGWIMQGIGPDFPDGSSPNDTFVSFIDNGILNINGTPNEGRSGIAPTVWTEWIQWQYWDGTNGRCKQWVNGQLLFDVTSASLGGTGTDYRFRLGIPYIQNRADDVVVYIDEVFAGDGFPNVVEP